jgi:hypothetical protein
MSVTTTMDLRVAWWTPRLRVRLVALLAIAVVTAIALALPAPSLSAHRRTARTRDGLSQSKPAALGLVRSQTTGQWTCVRVSKHDTAAE